VAGVVRHRPDRNGAAASLSSSTSEDRSLSTLQLLLGTAAILALSLARATALLGDPGKQMGKKFEAVYTDLVKGGENRKAENDGGASDKIRWVHAAKPAKGEPDDVVYFKRVKGEWLIDTVETYELNTDSGRDAAEKLIDSVPKVTALLKQVSADIRAKKITTVEQMRQRLAAGK